MKEEHARTARVFKALCDENRVAILEMLKSGEKCACAILEELSIAQSTLSHHMRILCESGLVESRQEGKWTRYSLSRQGCETAAGLLRELCAAGAPSSCGEMSACR